MQFVDEYRDGRICKELIRRIGQTTSRRWTIMEVCGGQTHGLLRYGIDTALSDSVRLIHGPGCPVCVTPLSAIDAALEIARRPGFLLATFGDMLRVPGERKSLLQARADGARVRMVYSPLDAVAYAEQHPESQVVFFAVGFETTIPATALAVVQAHQKKLRNFSVLVAHVRVLPAMRQLLETPGVHVDGFLAAGHVCTVTGYEEYEPFVREFGRPVVVTGFEPVDLLHGILECVQLLERGTPSVVNRYARSASSSGNVQAMQWVSRVFEPCDLAWRGLGVIRRGGYRLRDAWRGYDAAQHLARGEATFELPVVDRSDCRSGDVLAGRIAPTECVHFSRECTPDTPLGAPMVSSEGACAAYYRYARKESHL